METNGVEILLVEDNPSDLQLTLHALRKKNLANHIEVARDGEEALDFLLCRGRFSQRSPLNPPKLVLLDLKLPKVNGFEVLKQIKENPSTRALPVIILSSSNQLRDVDSSYQLGANGYVQKPVNFEEFSDAVRRIAEFWLGANLTPSPAIFKEQENEPRTADGSHNTVSIVASGPTEQKE